MKALAFMEAIMMPIPSWDAFPQEMKQTFQAFRTPDVGWDMIVNKHMFVEQVLPGAIVRKLTDAEMDHYREPYIDPPSRKPVWRWPNEIPIAGEPANVVALVEEYNRKLQQSALPKLLFTATPGALITAPVVDWCQQNLSNLKVVDIGPGIHFVQEDNPHLIGTELANWYDSAYWRSRCGSDFHQVQTTRLCDFQGLSGAHDAQLLAVVRYHSNLRCPNPSIYSCSPNTRSPKKSQFTIRWISNISEKRFPYSRS